MIVLEILELPQPIFGQDQQILQRGMEIVFYFIIAMVSAINNNSSLTPKFGLCILLKQKLNYP